MYGTMVRKAKDTGKRVQKMDQARIIVVDDEKEIADLLEVYLKNEGYHVHKYYNGEDALQCMKKEEIDLAVLDVMLPGIDGFALCKEIRERWYFPVIMLTAKVEDIDKITGLAIGADDYITKPFNPLEVVARVKTQLRRSMNYNKQAAGTPEKKEEYDIRGLVINNRTHECTLYGREVDFTPVEFGIVWYLCSKKGQVVSAEELFEAVWGEKYLDSNNTVMAHIAKIREKLGESSRNPKFVKTVWGVGYKID